MNRVRIVLAVVAGILVAFIVGSVIGTQMVLRSVEEMGLAVSWGMRLSSSWNDIVGLSASLLPLMAIALAPAWLLLAWLDRHSMLNINAVICAVCGALCVGLLHPILNMAFGVDVFAPARSWAGLMCQAAAGGLGGWAMASLCGSTEDVASNR